jgi:hypothetical protein
MADIVGRQTGRSIDPTKLCCGTGMMLMTAYCASAGGFGASNGEGDGMVVPCRFQPCCAVPTQIQATAFCCGGEVPS